MQGPPVGTVTAGAVAAGGEVLTTDRVLEAAVRIVTVGAGTMSGGAHQAAVVAAGATRRSRLNQAAVVRDGRCVEAGPRIAMAVRALAGRKPRLQVRYGGMAEVALAAVDDVHRRIRGRARFVTTQA